MRAENADLGVLDSGIHQLAVNALVNHWTDDDPRWSLLERAADTA
ncbi:hypothetical protein ACWCOV_31995 [Kribbella sp. NPDC002412]